ncbi:MAG TPA: Calx-beta domain-containing protein [Thermoanaerobaculia bacterium]|jgi:plastocyanin|nr:Calx-beta domain-containing protein [Thermoanaerobaculia bacterium]
MRLVRTSTALALPFLMAAAAVLLASPAAAQHHAMSGKVDYEPDPGGGDHDVPEGCVGVTNKVTINGGATAFSPATITIAVGQPVCWTWNTGGTSHNIKADDGSFTTGQPASTTTFQRTFTTPGTYGYYCQVHGSPTGGMRGTVVVQGEGDPDGGGSGPGTLSIDPGSYTVDEGGGQVSLTVTRTGGSDGKVTVKIATGTGSAAKGKDFLPRNAVLTWNPGDGDAKTFAVTIKQDTAIEPDETFPVTLTKPTGGATIGTSSATVTIHDDDGCPSSLAAPSGLKAAGQSAREIRLGWAADPMATKAVHVERRDDGGVFREVAVVPAGRSDYVDADLPSGAAFQYRLRAESDAGLSEYSEIAAAATDGAIGACAGGAHALCLGDGRFEATVKFRRADGEPLRSALRAEAPGAARAGLFAFAPGDDAQLMLKVADGCAENGHFWVQLAAVTDAELTVSVRDTQTGRTWAFYNPAGKVAGAVRDVDAFGTCP